MPQIHILGGKHATPIYHLFMGKDEILLPSLCEELSENVTVEGERFFADEKMPGYQFPLGDKFYFVHDIHAHVLSSANVMAEELLGDGPHVYLQELSGEYDSFLEACKGSAESDMNQLIFTGPFATRPRVRWVLMVEQAILVRVG